MQLTQILEYVKKQGYKILGAIIFLFRCIDDRYGKDNFSQGNYGIPGGGIGGIADVIAGLEAYLERDLTEAEFEIVYSTYVKLFGIPTCHTASYHVSVDSPVCGCGYLVQTVEGKTNISAASAARLKAKIHEIIAGGYVPVCFTDGHTAKFILVVKGYEIGINPEGGAYVYHADVHVDIITKMITELSEEFGISDPEQAIKTTLVVAGERLEQVIKDLGMENAPRYLVKSLEDVTLIETATAA